MCSFVRVGFPKGLGHPQGLGTSIEPGAVFPLEMSAAEGMRVSERKCPQSMEVDLTDEGKDDSGERGVLMGTKSPTELGFRVGLGKEDSSCRESLLDSNKFEERIASPETKSPLSKELEMKLKIQNLSRTLPERSNLGVYGVSASQETKSLGMLPGRKGLENDCLLAGCSGRMIQPHLGMVCESPQALGSRRGSVAGSDGELRASLGKQPTLVIEPRQELGKETCVVIKPSAEMKPPVEVDTGLPKLEEPGPQIGLVIEPSESQFAQQTEERKEAENTEPGIEPPDRIRPIYSGKFFDRMPSWPTAGKVIPVGDRVATCLTEKLPRLITPPEAKKFFNYRYPPAGAERVFYGRAKDPQIAPYLTHGIRSKISIPAKVLINPQPITTFQQKLKDKKESVYFSNQRAPLGKSHDQTPGLPKGLDVLNTTFGTTVIRDSPARDVVNPPKSYEEVFKEGKEGHDLYIVSHNDYYVGEAKNRKYNPSSFHRFNLYGVPTPHFNDGRAMAKTLYWLHELQMKKGAKIISKRVDDFKEKFQHKLGRVLDPIAETMNVPPDHTFGACLRAEEYGKKPACANPDEANVEESEPTLLIKPEDIVLKEPGSSEKTLRTLLRPSDKVSSHYKTTSSEINAVVGALPSTCYPIYGVPTIRSDIPAPRIRRVSDRTNYGEEGNAYSLLHPTIFGQKGVFERDFFKTRSKKEIAEILCNIGVKLSDEEFENVWNLASKKHHRGEVCVETIRNVLDEIQHADRVKCKTTM
ncbi:EF-hand domain-containing family member B isoform X2 [Mustela erminea]|uniref:EF-hand domain-containing family member B isoform X2 n=1 Tax=Mustela erminea TaxID=36723 RepID=UPI0013871467|nr:EF-hand domain-containing family member B isoform X2 [Mustela erminea]